MNPIMPQAIGWNNTTTILLQGRFSYVQIELLVLDNNH